MTAEHVHPPVLRPNSEIAERARNFRPGKFTVHALVTAVAWVFTAAGVVVGAAWFAAVFAVIWAWSSVSWTVQCFTAGMRMGARVPENGRKR